MSTPRVFDYVDLSPCQRDEAGLLAGCCWTAFNSGRLVGWVEGHAADRQSVYDDIDATANEVVANAARSINVVAARRKHAARWSG